MLVTARSVEDILSQLGNHLIVCQLLLAFHSTLPTCTAPGNETQPVILQHMRSCCQGSRVIAMANSTHEKRIYKPIVEDGITQVLLTLQDAGRQGPFLLHRGEKFVQHVFCVLLVPMIFCLCKGEDSAMQKPHFHDAIPVVLTPYRGGDGEVAAIGEGVASVAIDGPGLKGSCSVLEMPVP